MVRFGLGFGGCLLPASPLGLVGLLFGAVVFCDFVVWVLVNSVVYIDLIVFVVGWA